MWRPLAALGFGLILVLALDQTVRLVLSREPTAEAYRYLQMVQYHPVLGWSGYPNLVTTNDDILIQTNSLGYRDREPVAAEDGQTLRVLVLGDSFTWGDEVTVEERFTSLLEAPCGSSCQGLPPIRTINHGMIGYGTTQSFLQYLLTRHEQPFDLVILALYTGNDLNDNVVVDSPSGPRPRLIRCGSEGHGEELCLEGVPVPPLIDWPAHRWLDPRGTVARTFGWSGVIQLASRRRAPPFVIEKRIAERMKGMLEPVPFKAVERTSEAPIPDRIGLLEAILGALDRTVRGDGKAFGVLAFPSARVYAGTAGDELQEYRQVLGVLDRLHIPFVDYYEKTKEVTWDDLFSGRFGHWRPVGHQRAASLLRPLLVTLTDVRRVAGTGSR